MKLTMKLTRSEVLRIVEQRERWCMNNQQPYSVAVSLFPIDWQNIAPDVQKALDTPLREYPIAQWLLFEPTIEDVESYTEFDENTTITNEDMETNTHLLFGDSNDNHAESI